MKIALFSSSEQVEVPDNFNWRTGFPCLQKIGPIYSEQFAATSD